ncbi:MAG: acetamidase/formamidase family protein [Bradyrhizobiaceae bacterium]|nr:acetamidase/formamidase family protein [Bradyrhizobiaceae bacterium]
MDAATAVRIAATPQSVKWGFFDASTPAIAAVASGTEVLIETVSGEPAQIPVDPIYEILPEHRPIHEGAERGPGPHFLTGPVYVEGAHPGDVLAVDILDVTLRQNWGFNLIIPLLGTLPEDFPEFTMRHLPIDKNAGTVELPWGGKLMLSPFFGVMGVAPPPNWGRITSIIPRAHGGNMDNKELVAGTTVLYPVFNEGALFSVGDGHGVQGDGEVCITAVETALSGRFRLSVRKDLHLTAPRAETPTHYITMGFDEDLDDAVKQALRDMISWIGDLRGLSKTDAYTLCSLAADLHVTQTVNVAKGAHCLLPKVVLK